MRQTYDFLPPVLNALPPGITVFYHLRAMILHNLAHLSLIGINSRYSFFSTDNHYIYKGTSTETSL
jgi:hypothetical protein